MVKHFNIFLVALALTLGISRCKPPKEQVTRPARLDLAEKKLGDLRELAVEQNKIPRSEEPNGEIMWATKYDQHGKMKFDWTLGFFPGTCWYLYEHTNDIAWKKAAIKFQEQIEPFKTNLNSHDLGFVFYCSFGNGYRITGEPAYRQVLIEAGNSLLSRYSPTVGCIQSWNVDSGWQAERGWSFPVIIDNMMNLELLFELTELTGDNKYREVAIAHADQTLKHHFREDNSSYHVVDYDASSGQVRHKHTAQGFAHESAWARGQAWGLYGYTVCFRYTKDERYLNRAIKIADFMVNHPNLPADGVPYWDFNAPNIPDEPRDVSAAAITASALVELNRYTGQKYKSEVDKILKSLSSDAYLVGAHDETKFLLDHSVGSIPHGAEIDEPLAYADYYYVEAVLRQQDKQHILQ
ncbi:glycoside hydrolase family 88 protein [Marinoscillum furvescens]|uniref:Glycosyl hydrolase family 88 n=1 Tax=Marinoscillum furvescens DSM 4134 TaxID=1122208 RepID=A0A3D9L538_MARFU|nr:glycoside hydrolase family 88 protein [Marinoscillum furvescens]REE01145.1 glycosyl hydrolase family 88 [Marinoscillum furvescens DSM 4134]